MSTPIHIDVFAEVINSLMEELLPPTPCEYPFTFPIRVNIVHHLITHNLGSPILAEIHHLSFFKLTVRQMAALLPVLSKTTSLTSLMLPYCDASADHFKFLFTECHALSKLQSLDLSYGKEVKSPDLLLLSQSTTLTNLTSLNLRACHAVKSRADSGEGFATFGRFGGARVHSQGDGDEEGDDSQPSQQQTNGSSGLIALLSSPVVKNLTHLNLSNTDIDDPLVFIVIATSTHLSNLVSLDLSTNKVNSDVVAAFVASTTLINLTDLNLNSALNDQLATRLFSTPSLFAKKLKSINLGNNGITVSSLQVLANASPHLTELILTGNNDLELAVVEFIATHIPNLTKLNLNSCHIKNEGYAALVASTALFNLRELYLELSHADPENIIALINSPTMANLTHLGLDCTHEGPQVLTALAQSPSMSKLQHLRFWGNTIGDEGVIALAQSTTLTNLTWLDLGWNVIGPAGINALFTSPVVSKLTSLNLEDNEGMVNSIGNSIASALAAPTSTLYNILELNLRGTRTDDQDVLQLLGASNLDQLDALFVNGASSQTQAMYLTRFDIHPDRF